MNNQLNQFGAIQIVREKRAKYVNEYADLDSNRDQDWTECDIEQRVSKLRSLNNKIKACDEILAALGGLAEGKQERNEQN